MSTRLSDGFLVVADLLINRPDGEESTQADLRRAQSSIYYAMFHEIAGMCADHLVGSDLRGKPAWRQVYRSLKHGAVSKAFSKIDVIRRFPKDVQKFAASFDNFKRKREDADYDPYQKFSRSTVLTDFEAAEQLIQILRDVDAADLKALAVWILFEPIPGDSKPAAPHGRRPPNVQ